MWDIKTFCNYPEDVVQILELVSFFFTEHLALKSFNYGPDLFDFNVLEERTFPDILPKQISTDIRIRFESLKRQYPFKYH